MISTINSSFEIVAQNSRGTMYRIGSGRYPTYGIFDVRQNREVHSGQRKHVVAMWNQRYDFAQTRTFRAN